MGVNVPDTALVDATREIVLEGFAPHYGRLSKRFPSSALWQRMRDLGSQLWLDTGDMEAITFRWTRQFMALTTNNTLLNKEVQKGAYDMLVRRSADALRQVHADLDEQSLIHEIAFILNAYHALRLVERFDAFVSVELHTDLAQDVEASIGYGRRYHEICPDRFIIKVPLTPAGLIAAGRLSREGVPVNFTLGFSARQNLVICEIARPQYCNVFLGRLNQVIKENDLGSGDQVGERACSASQKVVRELRESMGISIQQIAASIRSGQQILDLAGVDVLTMPPEAASGFVEMGLKPENVHAGIDRDFQPGINANVRPADYAIDTLWDVPRGLRAQAEYIGQQDLQGLGPHAIEHDLESAGFGDVLPLWTQEDRQQARQDGKIPKLNAWRDRLAHGEIGLDALMTLHGLESFAKDQKAMDDRIHEHM